MKRSKKGYMGVGSDAFKEKLTTLSQKNSKKADDLKHRFHCLNGMGVSFHGMALKDTFHLLECELDKALEVA